jgi:DNA primase
LATLIPNETIKEIQRAADIVEVVSKRVLLKKTGKNLVGLCPFHTEKTPSFSVNPNKQIFYCFGCGTGGDVFSFLMKLDGLSFPEAARRLALLYGIHLPDQRLSPTVQAALSEKDHIFKVNRHAAHFFHNCLCNADAGRKAMTYLLERGMTSEIINRFNIGYAPFGWDHLLRLLKRKNFPIDLIQKAGLVIARKDNNGHYDRFRNRIILPIFDINQRVIGFGGRVMDDSLPKYLNSPETPVYHKSRSLYGVHIARKQCRELGSVYLVEGYFDLIALVLYGVENSVATLGTSLTAEHVQILRGLVGNSGKAILVYDSDEAGLKAAKRSIGVFEAGFLEAQILILPSGYDPDAYIRKYGKDSFLELSENALGVVSFLLESAIKQYGLSIDGKIKIIQELIAPLATLTDNVARILYVQNIAERLEIDEQAILDKVRQFNQHQKNQKRPFGQKVPVMDQTERVTTNKAVELNNRVRIERKLVAMMLNLPDIIGEIEKYKIVEQIQDETLRAIGRMVLEADANNDNILNLLLSRIKSDEMKRVVASLAISEEKWDFVGCQRLITQFKQSVKRGGDDLFQQIKTAEKNNDFELLQKLLLEKQMRAKGLRQHS